MRVAAASDHDSFTFSKPEETSKKILILGDSWIRGIGPTRKNACGRLLAESFGASELLDLSEISRIAPDIVESYLDDIIKFRPSIAILGLGGAESLIFPAEFIQKLIDRYAPPDWHGLTGLQTKIIVSRDRKKRAVLTMKQTLKIVVKQLSVAFFGGRRRLSAEIFQRSTQEVLDLLTSLGTQIIVLGITPVSHLMSPKTNKSLRQTNMLLETISDGYPSAIFIPTAHYVSQWEDYLPDRVHLSKHGHEAVARGVSVYLSLAGPPWTAIVQGRVRGGAKELST